MAIDLDVCQSNPPSANKQFDHNFPCWQGRIPKQLALAILANKVWKDDYYR